MIAHFRQWEFGRGLVLDCLIQFTFYLTWSFLNPSGVETLRAKKSVDRGFCLFAEDHWRGKLLTVTIVRLLHHTRHGMAAPPVNAAAVNGLGNQELMSSPLPPPLSVVATDLCNVVKQWKKSKHHHGRRRGGGVAQGRQCRAGAVL